MNKNIPAAIILAAAVVLSSACGTGAAQQTETAESTSAAQVTEASAIATEADTQATEEVRPEGMSEKTQRVYDYICGSFGKQMLSCQQESTWMGSPDYEMDYIMESTGKLPAMRGLDFMNNDFAGVVKRSEEWDAKGGLVTICWHTGVNGSGYQESLDDDPDFDRLLTEGTDEHNAMMKIWDDAAKALQKLRDADVPVLWRPFHEFDGQWFWWGKGGADNFIKLWRLMHDKFTGEYGLNNLIWVLGYSGEVKDGWYPGDEYVDIIGSDTYDNSTNKAAWEKLTKVADKPMAFHECGKVPPISRFEKDGDLWSWFMIWHTDYIKANSPKNLTAVYTSDKVITLDELPDFGEKNDTAETTVPEKENRMGKYADMIVELPPDGYDASREGVTYPEFKKYTYYSKTAERDTNVNVLLPADYSEDKKYPVLYILHGFYDNEDWMARKTVALSRILTNLQLDGEAEEMIVVLPYIFCSKELPYCTGMDAENCLAYDNFINDLTTDLIPFISKNFSVAEGRENTAITGFSMGGRESLFIGFSHPELFGYIGAVCPAPGLVKINGSAMHPGQMSAENMRFEAEKPAALLISSSKADGVVGGSPDSYRTILDGNGEEYLSHILTSTGHDHTSVRPHLYNYFRIIFR